MITLDLNADIQVHSTRIEHVVFQAMDKAFGESAGSCIYFLPELPEWFEKGLADCREGRVLDMDVALKEPPPGE